MMEPLALTKIWIKYMNVQHFNIEEHNTLRFTTHLTKNKPNVVVFSFTGRTKEQIPIKIPFYNIFVTNKRNEMHAKSMQFNLMNNVIMLECHI